MPSLVPHDARVINTLLTTGTTDIASVTVASHVQRMRVRHLYVQYAPGIGEDKKLRV